MGYAHTPIGPWRVTSHRDNGVDHGHCHGIGPTLDHQLGHWFGLGVVIHGDCVANPE